MSYTQVKLDTYVDNDKNKMQHKSNSWQKKKCMHALFTEKHLSLADSFKFSIASIYHDIIA